MVRLLEFIHKIYNNQKSQNSFIFKWVRNSTVSIFLSNYYIFEFSKKAIEIDNIRIFEMQDKLGDQESVDTLKMILFNRSKFLSRNNYIDCGLEEYFCIKDIFGQSLEGFNLLDVGAYNGDTIVRFIEVTNQKYTSIIGIEPDEKSFETMMMRLEELDIKRLKLINVAVSNVSSKKKFDQYGTVGSKLSQYGNSIVNVEKIDNLNLKFENGVFMKLDVEGEELNTLKGALDFIFLYKPFISVCLYHKPTDLWEIPLYIAQKFPEYKLYLRHHSKSRFETILYAIPYIPH